MPEPVARHGTTVCQVLRRPGGVNGDHVDIATIDILRDRERGVPRYNDFREKLRKRRVEKFEDLTPNPEWNDQIREVYSGDIDKVDTQVGMLGEKLPPSLGSATPPSGSSS